MKGLVVMQSSGWWKVFLAVALLVVLAGCGQNPGPGREAQGNAPEETSGSTESPDADYPTKPVKIIVQSQQGGSIDGTTRILADFASKKLGQPVVVENMTGAAGRVAWSHVFNSNPDGYTLGTVNVPSLQLGEVLFAPEYKSDEFSYVYGFVRTGHVLAVLEDSPINNVEDLIERMKQGRVTIGTFGKGTSGHLQATVFFDQLGVLDQAGFVHFEGSAPQTTALLGGDVEVSVLGYGTFTKTEGIRGLLAFAEERDPSEKLREVPVLSELGYDQVPVIDQIFGWVGAPGMPDHVVQKWDEVFTEARNDETVKEGFQKLSFEVADLDAARFRDEAVAIHQLVQQYADRLE